MRKKVKETNFEQRLRFDAQEKLVRAVRAQIHVFIVTGEASPAIKRYCNANGIVELDFLNEVAVSQDRSELERKVFAHEILWQESQDQHAQSAE